MAVSARCEIHFLNILPHYREQPVANMFLSDIFGTQVLSYFLFPHFQRIPLDFLQDESFKEAVAKYIKPLLTKVYFFTLESLCFHNVQIEYVSYISLMLVSGCSFIIF